MFLLLLISVVLLVSTLWGIVPPGLFALIVVVVVASTPSATFVLPAVTITMVAATVAVPAAPTVGVFALGSFFPCLPLGLLGHFQNLKHVAIFIAKYLGPP